MKKFFTYVLSLGLVCIGFAGYSQTFYYTGGLQTYTVPAGVTAIAVDAQGAMGGGINCAYTSYQSLGGCGGRVQATVNVTPGHVLNITVGGQPGATGGGGYGGGGNDLTYWTTTWPGAGGGGGTTIFDATAGTTLVVAGGGGGGGGDFCSGYIGGVGDVGGAGGGLIGGAGNSDFCGAALGGQGGTQVGGGAGSACTGTGGTGTAGNGANVPASANVGSGAGGGGWFGGGSGSEGAGGGGGSSYTNATYTIGTPIHTQGYNCSNGIAIISVACNAGTITGPSTTVCTGSTLSLTDATGGGVWSSSNTVTAPVSGTGVVTGGSAGTAIISYSVGGCSATYNVTVYAMPAPITGTLSVCQFGNTPLGETIGGGTWGSSNTAVATVSATGVVTGVTAGTSIVSYTTGGGCTQAVIVTVNAAPGTFTGTPNVCVGLTTTLSNTVAGGTWSSSNTAVGTISSPGGVLGGISGGTVTITYTMPGNCYTTEVATVNPAPSAIGGAIFTVCQGLTITLTDVVAGGAWSSQFPAIGSVNAVTGVVTGVSGGTTTITYTSANCTPVTAVVTVYPVSAISPSAPVVCTGVTLPLTDALAGTWSSSNTAVAMIGGTGILTGITPGTSTILFTFTTGCTTSVVATVNLSPVAISGTTTLCVNNVTTFSDGTGGGAWSSSNTAVGTIVSGSGVFTAISAGTTTISYVMPSTGCFAISVLTVNPIPALISGNMYVCAGLTTTLNETTAGGTWSSNPIAICTIGATTGVVFGEVAGTAIISYTLPTGCYSLGVFTVNPSPQAILGNHGMCLGYTTQLSDVSTGGTWSSSNTVVGTIDASSGLAMGLSIGTTTITYSLAAGCTSTTTVTVNPNPAAITGTGAGCIGFTTTLSDPTAGGTWSTSNNIVAIIGSSSGTVSALSPGNDTVYYTLNTGCSADMIFTVNPQPAAISGGSYLCVGLSTTFTDASGGGTWSAYNANATVGSASGLVTGVSPGVDIITYTLPTTCYVTAPITITTPPTAITGPNNVCVNSSITLSDGTVPGTWTLSPVTGNASISASGVVTGISSGIVVATYTTFACNPVYYEIQVNPLPTPIIGIGNLCVGSSTSLTDITPGGTWSSSNPGATVSSTGVVSGVDTGAGTNITYTLPTGCYVSVPVIVFPIPKPIMGVDSVCPGSSVILTDSTPSGVWSSSDGTIDTCFAFSGEIKGIRAGSVTISYTLISGCYVTMHFTVISPLPATLSMTQSPTPLICNGDPVTFTATSTNGGTPTYTWMRFGTIFLASGTSNTYTYSGTFNHHGDYITCIMTTGNICASPAVVQVSQVVNIYPQVTPVVTISTLAPNDTAAYLGDAFTFYSNVTNGGIDPTYQWYINSTAVPGATNNTFTTNVYNENDTVYCIVNATPPCDLSGVPVQSNTSIVIYGLGYLSASSLSTASNDLSLFPNPNTGSFTLSGTVAAISNKEVSLEVVDMLGRTVYTGTTLPQNNAIHTDIKLGNDAAAGTYLLHVYTETGTETFHFVIGK